MSNNEGHVEPFQVYARVRQLLDKETQNPYNVKKRDFIQIENNEQITIQDPDSQDFFGKRERVYNFDKIFTENDDNKFIFDTIIKSMVDNTIAGYNSTALAYGVTGTGKTHTMFGNIYDEFHYEKGVCIHVADYLFDKIHEESSKNFSIKMSYLEIYNEQVIDLMVDGSPQLMILEDMNKGILVQDLSEYSVTNSNELLQLIITGNSRRFMAATGQNQFSSRSHAILQITMEQRQKLQNSVKEEVTISKFLMVDLAGSERGGLEKGIRTHEGSNINKSLLALANCINILSDKSKKGNFVPYRNSKLTRILKDSLGGNIRTIMIACISPAPTFYDETINTLNYASRARRIQKKITKNVKEVDNNPQYRDLIDNLKLEIEQLKEIISTQNILIYNKKFEDEYNLGAYKKEEDAVGGPNKEKEEDLLSLLRKVESHKTFLENPQKLSESIPNTSRMKKELNENSFYDQAEQTKKALEDIKENRAFDSSFEFDVVEINEDNCLDLEKIFDNLKKEKQVLEKKLATNPNDELTNTRYKTIKLSMERYIDLLNDKIIENIEQNMILKINLKDIMKLNENNKAQLEILENSLGFTKGGTEEETKIQEEIADMKKAIEENELEIQKISDNTQKNIKMKGFYKNQLLILISNTHNFQTSENVNLNNAYKALEGEKHEIEMNLIKCQKYLTNVIRDKQDQEKQLQAQKKEIERLKGILVDQEKKIGDTERQLKKMKIKEDNMNLRKNKVKKNKKKEKKYDDDKESKYTFNLTDLVKSTSHPQSSKNIENIEINLQDEFFNSKKKSGDEKNNLFKNVSLSKILDEFYSKNQTSTAKKGLNSSSINFNTKFNTTKNVNNIVIKPQAQAEKVGAVNSRSKSNKKKYELEHPGGDVAEVRRIKVQTKKSTPLNMVNKNMQHYSYKYGNIYPSDRNQQNQMFKDPNLANRVKSNIESKTRAPEHGHNHSLSISVVTINDEIVFNSETIPNENNFNLDDTEVSRSKNVLYKKPEELVNFPKSEQKPNPGLNSANNNMNNPIIQFNQFNTFQVKSDGTNNNKLNFFGQATNYDKIFEQPANKAKGSGKNSKQNKQSNQAPSLEALKKSLLGTNQNFDFSPNFRHDFIFQTSKNLDFGNLLTDPNKGGLENPNDIINFFEQGNLDSKKKRTVRSVEPRKGTENKKSTEVSPNLKDRHKGDD